MNQILIALSSRSMTVLLTGILFLTAPIVGKVLIEVSEPTTNSVWPHSPPVPSIYRSAPGPSRSPSSSEVSGPSTFRRM